MFKKKSKYEINIPSPCHEDWHGMTPAEKGRFCVACNTVVKDFSGMSDAEIISELQQANNKMCGRFLTTQLNRELKEASPVLAIPKPNWVRKITASLLMFYSFMHEAAAQQKSLPAAQHIVNNANSARVNNKADAANIIIKGKVLDYYNNQPLKKLEFEIRGTVFKCVTDIYGRFKFQLPDSLTDKDVFLDPSPSTLKFLDSTSSFIPSIKVVITNFPFKQEVVLYRYPIETISISYTGEKTKQKIYKETTFTGSMTVVNTPIKKDSQTDKKKNSMQKFKAFFQRKKEGT